MAPKKKKVTPRKRLSSYRERMLGLEDRQRGLEDRMTFFNVGIADARERLGKLENLQRETRLPEREPTQYTHPYIPAVDKLKLVRQRLKAMLEELG